MHGSVIFVKGETVVDMSGYLPVDEVARMEYRYARKVSETRGHHPVVISDAYDIGVGIVGMYDGVAICAVAEIGCPLRACGCAAGHA